MINQKSLNIPEPTEIMSAHSAALCQYIHKKMAEGPLSFAAFMNAALYAPGLGYYTAGKTKFGSAGDFVTAPEISPIFSYCLANQCAEVLWALPQSNILELGAGSGRMAIDILTHLKHLKNLPQHYYILEVSADLQEKQKFQFSTEAPEFLSRVIWLDTLPRDFEGVIIANEVMDAMPVNIFHRSSIWQEIFVTPHENGYQPILQPVSEDLLPHLNHLERNVDISKWKLPYTSEVNLLLRGWIDSLSHCLKRGVILLIDYGFPRHEYYHPERNQGTLMCHYHHHAHADPFHWIGLQDITAHVDFTHAAEAGTQAGLSLEGFNHQAAFLINCGITDFSQTHDDNNAIQKLTHPGEMGELFKVIGFSKSFDESLRGFSAFDMTHRL